MSGGGTTGGGSAPGPADASSARPGERQRWLVVGAGSFGTTITRVLGGAGVEVTLAARTAEHVAQMAATGTNERYFPGVPFPEHTRLVTVDDAAAEGERRPFDCVVLAVPTGAFRPTLERFADAAPLILSLGKGLDPSGCRLGQVAADVLDDIDRFVVLSGPNIAREMIQDLPTAAVVAGTGERAVLEVQRVLNGFAFRVYASRDVVGVELAGASKNVIAIAAGVLLGSGMGDNAIAAMMTRGLGEMARLGLAHGASLQTYLGLAGVGDLMVTCRSPHSRNNRAGRLIAEGHDPDGVRAEIGQVVEGMRTAPIVRDMAREAGIEMHICEAVADVVEHAVPLPEVVRLMMRRSPGWEFQHEHEFSL